MSLSFGQFVPVFIVFNDFPRFLHVFSSPFLLFYFFFLLHPLMSTTIQIGSPACDHGDVTLKQEGQTVHMSY